MGAVCYKPKRVGILKSDILKAISDKHMKDSITEPDSKTLKTEE
jgi:hypothetical protein